jgi:hypothetical protein
VLKVSGDMRDRVLTDLLSKTEFAPKFPRQTAENQTPDDNATFDIVIINTPLSENLGANLL